MSEIVLDVNTLEAFDRWSGLVPAGYWGNWLGVLMATEVWAFPEETAALCSKDRYQDFTYPIKDEHVLD